MEKFNKKIWLATPTMHGTEMQFVQQAYDTNWIKETLKLVAGYLQ